jgi:peptidoglycan L-alanyl-D-glutamate endopeptidase CwlK
MSAGSGKPTPKVSNDLGLLAPKFRAAVEKAIADCKARGIDAIVYEAYRSQELQALYYQRGRTIIPPTKPVTYAPTNLYSWHGYGLAVDVVHRTKFWEPEGGEAWFKDVAVSFKKFACSWGGDWKQRDLPHFQWGQCKPSPSDAARKLLAEEGVEAVWQEVDAA